MEFVETPSDKPAKSAESRSLFQELMAGVEVMRQHREGRLTLRTTEVAPITIPPIDPDLVLQTREALQARTCGHHRPSRRGR